MTKLTAALALALTLAASSARAQSVIVTDAAGRETTGRLVRWTDSSIVLKTRSGERTFAAGEALRMDLRADSLKNGFLIGAAVGSLGGLISDCPKPPHRSCPRTRAAFTVLGAATWGAIGADIDALIPGRRPLWRAGP